MKKIVKHLDNGYFICLCQLSPEYEQYYNLYKKRRFWFSKYISGMFDTIEGCEKRYQNINNNIQSWNREFNENQNK